MRSTLRLSLRLYPLLVGEYAEQTFLLAQSFYSSQRSHQSAPSHCYWTRLYKSTVASVILWLKGLVPCLELLVFHSSSVAEVVIIKWSSVSRSKCFQKRSFLPSGDTNALERFPRPRYTLSPVTLHTYNNMPSERATELTDNNGAFRTNHGARWKPRNNVVAKS